MEKWAQNNNKEMQKDKVSDTYDTEMQMNHKTTKKRQKTAAEGEKTTTNRCKITTKVHKEDVKQKKRNVTRI